MTNNLRRFASGKAFYGWYIAVAGAAMNALMNSLVIFGFGVFISSFRQEFGWSVTAIAVGFSIKSLETGLMSPFTGFLQDKLGPRRMAIIGLTLVVIAYLLYSRVQSLPMYYAGAAIMALGQSMGGYSAFTVTVMRWFNKGRGRAMGILNVGNGLGFFGPLFLASLIAALGWRETLVACSVILAVVGYPLTLLIRDNPEDYGYLPDGEKAKDPAAANTKGSLRSAASKAGFEVKEAMRTPAFYLLVLTQAVFGFAHSPWNTLQVPHLEAAGFSLKGAGVLIAIYGVTQIPMRLSVGFLADKFGRTRVYKLGYACHGVGLACFAFLSPTHLWLVPCYYVFFGIAQGVQHTAGQSIMADYFGPKRYASIRGLGQALVLPASILAPIFAGQMFDINGNYRLAYVVLGMISATGLLWLSLIRRPLWSDLPQAKEQGPAAAGAGRR